MREPFVHFSLGGDKRVTWQVGGPLTETERLAVSTDSPIDALSAGLVGPSCG